MSRGEPQSTNCDVCGVPLSKDDIICPMCGSTSEPSSMFPEAQRAQERRLAASDPRRRRPLLYFGLGLLALLLLLAGAAAYGVYSGLQEREQMELTAVATHYQRGIESLKAADYALAVAEFEYVERLRPGYEETATLLQEARQAMVAKPTPTSQAREDIAAGLLARAQDEMERSAWNEAIKTLQDLQDLLPTYKAEQVRTLLFQSMYSAGQQAVYNRDVTAALEWFRQAGQINPQSADVNQQIALASTYLAAMDQWGRDWPAVIEQFETLYRLSPKYGDVVERLATAYSRYGDQLSSDGRWCDAAAQYAQALDLGTSPTLSTKAELARAYCAGRPTPGPDDEPTADPFATPEPGTPTVPTRGRIYFAMRDSATGSVGIYVLDPESGRPLLLLRDADQPSVRRDGSIAFRNLQSDQLGLGMARSDGSFIAQLSRYVEDVWATWEPGDGRVAFASTRESDRKSRIYIGENWSTSPKDTMVTYGSSPSWGPSGAIAYRGCDLAGNNCGLYQIRPEGGTPSQLTNDPSDDMPAWSPDGKRLAFASPRSGSWSIWVREGLGAAGLKRLTDDRGHDTAPVWSPDGTQIAFLSNRGGTWGIWVVGLAGEEPTLLWEITGPPSDWSEMRIDWR